MKICKIKIQYIVFQSVKNPINAKYQDLQTIRNQKLYELIIFIKIKKYFQKLEE